MKKTSPLFWALSALPTIHAGKQGLALISSTAKSDVGLLTSAASPISWYYTWSPYPSDAINASSNAVFLPLLHGLDAVQDDDLTRILDDLPDSSSHILSFNEPDHGTDDGGSDIDPKDAAEAYIEFLSPLREGKEKGRGRTWNISHPVVTSSEKGLDWLREFNASCWDIDEDHGCPTDFVAVHYYGPFEGLKYWIDTLDEFYNKNGTNGISGGDDDDDDNEKKKTTPFWITEFALPDGNAEETAEMLNKSMAFLDQDERVAGYAWFGAFREEDSNDWTGDGVSMFDDDGGLTELGSEYLGGEDNGLGEGTEGDESVNDEKDDGDGDGDDDDAGAVLVPSGVALLGVALTTILACWW